MNKYRDSFAVFILTHGRANNVFTYNMLKKSNYTGKIYFVVDDDDEQLPKYIRNFGRDNVIEMNKQEVYNRIDTMDNFNRLKGIIYARNECFNIAKRLGLKYFLELDDDYTNMQYRYVEGDSLKIKLVTDADTLFESMLDYFLSTNAYTLALAQGGDFIGGADGGNFKQGILRKAMNTFFCSVDRPFEFKGTINEDVNTYTTESHKGNLFLTYTQVMIHQVPTQAQAGGMTDMYVESGTYVKSFYSVITCPSAVKVSVMGDKHFRIHHKVFWNNCAPKILNEMWRK